MYSKICVVGYMSLLFNQTCLNKRLLSNYTYFKIHDPTAQHDTGTHEYRCSLVI